MKPDIRRMWINQPSAVQDHHLLHGQNVLADFSEYVSTNAVTIYFLSGNVISQQVAKASLSKGWRGLP